MSTDFISPSATILPRDHFDALIRSLREDGYQTLGPIVRDGAITYAEIERASDLPEGWTEVQEAGTYRLVRRNDHALFGFASTAQSWKPQFFVPTLTLLRVRRSDGSFRVLDTDRAVRKIALIGARSCDLHGIAVQDRTFAEGAYVDRDYVDRRSDTFVVAVQCGQAGGTCFCASMNTGPKVERGFDVALTELIEEGGHRFVAVAGTARGQALLERVGTVPATPTDVQHADDVIERTRASMGRTVRSDDLKDLLYRNVENPRWNEVATRCIACTNCTLVCPTCFCATIEDRTDLSGDEAERMRRWDSCFTLEHSWVHGGSVRSSVASRYRQWLTHKVASWIDQFGTSGCVGCGRCITWCPAAIDITEEIAALRASDMAVASVAPLAVAHGRAPEKP